MTLVGRFGNTTGRPYIEGRLHIPRLSVHTHVSFLIDTGADQTTLMPADSTRMGLDFTQLQPSKTHMAGIGGTVDNSYIEQAVVVFPGTDNLLYCYSLELGIMPEEKYLTDAPSLLGRDILKHWVMLYAPPTNELTMQVRFAHRRIPIDGCGPN